MNSDRQDRSRRKTLVVLTAAAGGIATVGAAVPFLASLGPSERAKAAGAPVELDLTGFQHSGLHTVEWRGRPVWILKRTPDRLKRLQAAEPFLSDPTSAVSSQQPPYAHNPTRSIEPEVLGGFYCPCHGSKFDLAGRVDRGSPAPTNLVIPPHQYLSASTILVGDDGKA